VLAGPRGLGPLGELLRVPPSPPPRTGRRTGRSTMRAWSSAPSRRRR